MARGEVMYKIMRIIVMCTFIIIVMIGFQISNSTTSSTV